MDMYFPNLDDLIANERENYIEEAECGDNTDWAIWDDNAVQDSIVAIWRILNLSDRALELPMPIADTERVALCKDIIRKLIVDAAEGHVNQMQRNGRF